MITMMLPTYALHVLIFMTILFTISNCYYCPPICICGLNFTSCQYGNLNELPDGLDPNTTSLDLSHNAFERFPSMSLENLIHLNLSHNRISSLDGRIFYGIWSLEYLDLSYNNFKDWRDVRGVQFNDARKLLFLDFSHNSLMGEPHFGQINSLEILSLVNCSVQSLTNNLFDRLPNLRELHLSENPIVNLNVNLESSTLKFLDLSRCNLQRISPWAFYNLTALETMHLYQNMNLKRFTCSSETLLFLDLSDCNLESVPIGYLPRLYHANFHGNHFRIIPDNSFRNFTSLRYLDLSYNALSIIEENAFHGLDKLESIDLSLNTLTTVLSPILFSTNSRLKYLNLSRNYFSEVIKFNIKMLKVLDLSSCEIHTIDPDCLDNMPNLETLNLSKNIMSHIPDHFHAPNLVNLDASFCRIKSINNRTFYAMVSLRNLNLAGNRLTTVCADCFLGVFHLDISDNPWRCDCDTLRGTYLWLDKTGKNVDGLICQSPESVEGLSWSQACQNEWVPKNATKDTVWWYTTGLLLTVFILLFVLLAIRRVYVIKEKRLRREEERRRADEREALRRMRRMQLEAQDEVNQNAPDPRELQTPPTYNEALLLPKLDASHPSLAGSLASFGSKHSLHASNPDVAAKRTRPRRKRRRRKSDSSEGQRASRVAVDSSDASDHDEQPQPRTTLESDF